MRTARYRSPFFTQYRQGWAPSEATVGGSTPDYSSLIENDPSYAAWKASATGRRSNLASQRAAAIRALVLHQGGMPAGFSDVYGDLTPEDLAAAQNNQFSSSAQIKRSYEQGVEAMHRSLAARGGLQSGELGYGQNQADYARGQAENQSLQDFQNSIFSALSDYAGGMSSIDAEEPGVIAGAEQNVEQQYPADPGHTAQLVENWQQYGFPVYLDDSGRYWRWDPNTQRVAPFNPGDQNGP